MVSPATNCSPISRIARSIALRITGSPPRASSRVSAAPSPSSVSAATSRPVTSRPQVAALTKSGAPWPRCARQSPRATLSRMSASRVASSGMRSSASARHISATPSGEESAYSWTSASTPIARGRARSRATRSAARRAAKDASSRVGVAASRSGGRQAGSGRRQAARIAARRGAGEVIARRRWPRGKARRRLRSSASFLLGRRACVGLRQPVPRECRGSCIRGGIPAIKFGPARSMGRRALLSRPKPGPRDQK